MRNPFLSGRNPNRGGYLLPFGTLIGGTVRTDWFAYPATVGSDDRYVIFCGDACEEVDAGILAQAVEVTGESADYAMWNEGDAEPTEETRQEAIVSREYHSPPPRLFLSLSRLSARIIDGSETSGRQMLAFLLGVRERRLTPGGTLLRGENFTKVASVIGKGEARGNVIWFSSTEEVESTVPLMRLRLDALNAFLKQHGIVEIPADQLGSVTHYGWEEWVHRQLEEVGARVEVV